MRKPGFLTPLRGRPGRAQPFQTLPPDKGYEELSPALPLLPDEADRRMTNLFLPAKDRVASLDVDGNVREVCDLDPVGNVLV